MHQRTLWDDGPEEEATATAKPQPRRYALARPERGEYRYVANKADAARTGPMPIEHIPGKVMILTGISCKIHRWTHDPARALNFTSEQKARDFREQQARIIESRIIILERRESAPDLIHYERKRARDFRTAAVFRIT